MTMKVNKVGSFLDYDNLFYKNDDTPNSRELSRCGYYIDCTLQNKIYVKHKKKIYGYICNSYDIK